MTNYKNIKRRNVEEDILSVAKDAKLAKQTIEAMEAYKINAGMLKSVVSVECILTAQYKTDYVNVLMKMNTKMFIEDKNIGVGQTTICSDVYTSILLMEDQHIVKYTKLALHFAFERMDEERADEAGYSPVLHRLGKGTGEYVGLIPFLKKIDGRETLIHPITVEDEHNIINEMLDSDLDDVENCKRILKDINRIFRMYQEKTIDAAKKLYKIAQNFYMIELRHNSSCELEHNFAGFDKFKVPAKKEDALDALDVSAETEAEADKNEEEKPNGFIIKRKKADFFMYGEEGHEKRREVNGEIKKIVFQDVFGEMQEKLAILTEDYINIDAYKEYSAIKLEDEEKEELGLASGLAKTAEDLYYYIRKPYGVVMSWYSNEINKANMEYFAGRIDNFTHKTTFEKLKELKNDAIERLSAMARYILRDLSKEEAGKLMFICSKIVNKGKGDLVHELVESTNQIHLIVAPELYFAYQAAHADIDVCGYKLIGNTSNLVEGETITLVEGNADNNLFTASGYTGEMTAKFHNNAWYAVKPISSVKASNSHSSLKEMSIFVPQYSVLDAAKYVKDGNVEYSKSFDKMKYTLEKANKCTLMPIFRVGKKVFSDVIVAEITPKDDPQAVIKVPVAKYICNSEVMENALAGLTFTDVKLARVLPNADGAPSTTMEIRIDLQEATRDNEVELHYASLDEFDYKPNMDIYAKGERNILNNVPDPLALDGGARDEEAMMTGCSVDADIDVDSLYMNDFGMDEEVLDMFNDLV